MDFLATMLILSFGALAFVPFARKSNLNFGTHTAILFLFFMLGGTTALAASSAPASAFAITPSNVPSIPINATVTRSGRTISAALVPYLEDGDQVSINLSPYYETPTQNVRYEANVVFYVPRGRPTWLFPPNSCDQRLFSENTQDCPNHVPKALTFTYHDALGQPIVVIVPQDRSAQNLDPGARSYVENNMDSLLSMSQTSNDAADKFTWFESFLQGISDGNIFYGSGASSRVATMASALSGNSSGIQTCYTTYATETQKPDLVNCIQGVLNAAATPTNGFSGTQLANLLGIGVGSVPLSIGGTVLSPYVTAAADVLNLFITQRRGKYRYTPAVLYPRRIGPVTSDVEALLDPITSVGVRPNASISDVIFFTVGGDTSTTDDRPSVVYDTPPSGSAGAGLAECAFQDHVSLPFHFSSTSMYMWGATASIQPLGKHVAPEQIPLDVRNLIDPVILTRPDKADKNQPALDYANSSTYQVTLSAQYGFDQVQQPVTQNAIIAVPQNAIWSIQSPIPAAGSSGVIIVSSPSTGCLDSINVIQGSTNSAIASSSITPIDATQFSFTLNLANYLPGDIRLEFVQYNRIKHRKITDFATIRPLQQPALKATYSPVAYLGDSMLFLQGSGLTVGTKVRIGASKYSRDQNSNPEAGGACYDNGPAISGFSVGDAPTAYFLLKNGSAGPPFSLGIEPSRPQITGDPTATVTPSGEFAQRPNGVTLSTDDVAVSVTPASISNVSMLVRKEPINAVDVCDPLENAISTGNPISTVVGNSIIAPFRPVDVLTNNASGKLQVAIKDTGSGGVSDWREIKNLSVILVPDILSISCHAAQNPGQKTCTMLGRQFSVIQSVTDSHGNNLIINPSCQSTDPSKSCILLWGGDSFNIRVFGLDSPLTVSPTLVTNAS